MNRQMRRYRIDVAYHGRRFHGWQRQPNVRTVQGELEEWLGRLLGCDESVGVTGAGRTDAGVHAERMVAHFDTDREFDFQDLIHRLNSALDDDLVVRAISSAPADFHARYSAVSKTYCYRLRTTPSPFSRDRVWQLHQTLDHNRLIGAAGDIVGTHDFAGFCRAESRKPNTVCTIRDSRWVTVADCLEYWITGDRFLHEMVRLLVGTMVDIGRGQMDKGQIARILSSGDVRLCGQAAPPHGLSLVNIEYPA
ncbi:MAG: tRNA pseudouridine(38-40) synthase TruA [Candidatus Zixiibacteriota bacterium]